MVLIYADSNMKVMFLQCVEIAITSVEFHIQHHRKFQYLPFRVVENGKETVTVTEDGKVVKHLVNGEEKQAIKG